MEAYFASGEITWVVCPRSNDYIEGAHPPATLLMNKGVRIALGTDSLASNESLSLVEEMKLLPEIPLHERIRWATQNGAETLGITDWAGSFEVGKHPGAVGGGRFRLDVLTCGCSDPPHHLVVYTIKYCCHFRQIMRF